MTPIGAWNHAPKRLWKRVSVYIRPDIHAEAEKNSENFTLFVNNALASKYDLELCFDRGAYRANRLRQLEQTSEALEREIASLTAELDNDRLVPGLREELEREHARIVAARDGRARAEAAAAAKADCIRVALDAIIGDGSIDRYRRMLPENDPHGDLADALDDLVDRVSRRCGEAVDPAGLVAEVRRRAAEADAGEGS